jgi:hypothetical protein
VTHVVQFRATTRTFAVLPPAALSFITAIATVAAIAAILMWRQPAETALLNTG